MEEDQERDSSPDPTRHIIDDGDMEDSPMDTPDLWMSERNKEETKFERTRSDDIFDTHDNKTKHDYYTSQEIL